LFYRLVILIFIVVFAISFFTAVDRCQAQDSHLWRFTLAWTHPNPDNVATFKIYGKNVWQTWETGLIFDQIPNAMTEFNIDNQEWISPRVFQENVFYCFMAAAVSHSGRESHCYTPPSSSAGSNSCWACMWIKATDMWITE